MRKVAVLFYSNERVAEEMIHHFVKLHHSGALKLIKYLRGDETEEFVLEVKKK